MRAKTLRKLRNLKKAKKVNLAVAAVAGVVVLVAGYLVLISSAASGATLSLNPPDSIIAKDQTFTITIRQDSGNVPVNAVQANLSYPADKLEVVNIDTSTSAFPLEAETSAGEGSIKIARGTSGGQSVTGNQIVALVIFKTLMNSGSAEVTFASGSAVVSSADNSPLSLTTVDGTYQTDTVPPSAPTSLRTTNVGGTSVSLAWDASTDNVGVTGYDVYRNGAKIATTSNTSYTNSGLSEGTTYQYAVRAFDAAGNESVSSDALSVTTLDLTPPSVPTGVSLQVDSHSQIKVSWNASTDTGGSGLAGYKVYRGNATNPIATTTTTEYTDSGLSGNTSYTYRVSAYDAADNESAKSSSASATTPPAPDTTPPTTPGNLRVSERELSTISLAWNASTDNVAVSGYRVYRDGNLIASPSSTSYTDKDLAHGTTYQYSVRAIDTSDNLSSAAFLSATTLSLKTGDINHDNKVDIIDLSLLLARWGTADPAADLNNDGVVNIIDLSMLLSNWGK